MSRRFAAFPTRTSSHLPQTKRGGPITRRRLAELSSTSQVRRFPDGSSRFTGSQQESQRRLSGRNPSTTFRYAWRQPVFLLAWTDLPRGATYLQWRIAIRVASVCDLAGAEAANSVVTPKSKDRSHSENAGPSSRQYVIIPACCVPARQRPRHRVTTSDSTSSEPTLRQRSLARNPRAVPIRCLI